MSKKIDKRTKAYKKSLELGDAIEKITEATGIKKLVEWFANGKDCGCDKRKENLNKKYHYVKINCMEESEYIWISEYNERKKENRIESEDVTMLLYIFNRIFDKRAKICRNCPSGMKDMQKIITHLNNVYNSYKEEL